jgi:hypothetical protein
MDFLKKAAGGDQQLSGILGGLDSALNQKNAEGGQAPASGDQISNLMGTLSSAMNQKQGEGSTGDSQVQGAMSHLQGTLSETQKQEQASGSDPKNPLGALMNAANSALGGGASGEAKEDKLDKAVDMFQEHVMKAGSQENESAVE